VTIPRERTAWAGPVSPEAIEQILGIRIGLHDLVGSLVLGNRTVPGVAVRRDPAAGAGLPRLFVIEAADRRLTLERRGRKKARRASSTLGTGSPPPGVQVRTLEELGEGEQAGLVLESEIPPQ
jgi:hypothetical protein